MSEPTVDVIVFVLVRYIVDIGETLLQRLATECEGVATSEKAKREGNRISMYFKSKNEKA